MQNDALMHREGLKGEELLQKRLTGLLDNIWIGMKGTLSKDPDSFTGREQIGRRSNNFFSMITGMRFIVQLDIEPLMTSMKHHFFVNACKGILFGCSCPFYTWLIMIK